MNTFSQSADPRISLIFVNYQSAKFLNKALDSLFSLEQAGVSFEVIIVNNDASESVALQALRQAYPILLIESPGNKGFGQGNNLGAKQARGSLLGFINPDVVWIEACLREIERIFAAEPAIGILGMALLDEEHKPEAWSAGKAPNLITLFQNNVFPARYALCDGNGLSFPDWVSGAALFIRAPLFSAIGGFDERFFLYFEDVDLCTAARKRGLSVARHSAFPLIHLRGQSQRSVRDQKKHFYDSQRAYFSKHRPVWENKVLRCLRFFSHKP
ncbi:MAG: hypothetical protein A2878_00890 [Candidatus Moranbacteria bacterium RIFCSPHIGHO2_01_FULL_54_31]|nr:MAG: hypothetical protein A2878_00890 [Candidatus Moranbacteria bacterium RIFCSPHIGHO2_01_FULL_54_31]